VKFNQPAGPLYQSACLKKNCELLDASALKKHKSKLPAGESRRGVSVFAQSGFVRP